MATFRGHAHGSCASFMRMAFRTTCHFPPLWPDSRVPEGTHWCYVASVLSCVAIRQERCKICHVTLPRSKYAFLTLPRYSMIALSNAVEPLRMANIITGQTVYQWSIVSLDGQPTPASNGLQLSPTMALELLGPVDILFVCGGVNVQEAVSPKILAALRRLAERRIPLGALCTGGYALAKAGLLDKYRATIHWENLSALREEFPRIQLSDQLFSIDRDRFTCSGGVARSTRLAAHLRAVHRRARAQRPRPAVRAAASSDRREPREPDQGGAAHGGEHREAAVAR